MLGLIISSGMGTIAMAQSNAEEETLSEIGVKTGLVSMCLCLGLMPWSGITIAMETES